jgi:hypothetical protein
MRELEVPDSAVDLLTPDINDFIHLLEDTQDSIPRIFRDMKTGALPMRSF